MNNRSSSPAVNWFLALRRRCQPQPQTQLASTGMDNGNADELEEERRENCCHYYKVLDWCIEDYGPNPWNCRTWRNLLKAHSCIPKYKTRYCTKDPFLDSWLEEIEARKRAEAEAEASQKKDH